VPQYRLNAGTHSSSLNRTVTPLSLSWETSQN
jgi:hypothetical protein